MAADNAPVASTCRGRKHRSFTVEFKLSVVDWVEERSSSVRAAATHFGLDRKVLRSWLRQKTQLRLAVCSERELIATIQ